MHGGNWVSEQQFESRPRSACVQIGISQAKCANRHSLDRGLYAGDSKSLTLKKLTDSRGLVSLEFDVAIDHCAAATAGLPG